MFCHDRIAEGILYDSRKDLNKLNNGRTTDRDKIAATSALVCSLMTPSSFRCHFFVLSCLCWHYFNSSIPALCCFTSRGCLGGVGLIGVRGEGREGEGGGLYKELERERLLG